MTSLGNTGAGEQYAFKSILLPTNQTDRRLTVYLEVRDFE